MAGRPRRLSRFEVILRQGAITGFRPQKGGGVVLRGTGILDSRLFRAAHSYFGKLCCDQAGLTGEGQPISFSLQPPRPSSPCSPPLFGFRKASGMFPAVPSPHRNTLGLGRPMAIGVAFPNEGGCNVNVGSVRKRLTRVVKPQRRLHIRISPFLGTRYPLSCTASALGTGRKGGVFWPLVTPAHRRTCSSLDMVMAAYPKNSMPSTDITSAGMDVPPLREGGLFRPSVGVRSQVSTPPVGAPFGPICSPRSECVR